MTDGPLIDSVGSMRNPVYFVHLEVILAKQFPLLVRIEYNQAYGGCWHSLRQGLKNTEQRSH
jgi:hypothetical protein